MWKVESEEDIQCTNCRHTISSGTTCLSQMPPIMPDDFCRNNYDNFCIECLECDEHTRPCYSRKLMGGGTRKEDVTADKACGHCGSDIPVGTRTYVLAFYDWPDSETHSESKGFLAHHGGAAAGMTVGTATQPTPAVWNKLSRSTQRQFQVRGLGRGLGTRTPKMAQRLFEKEVPRLTQSLGESRVKDHVAGKHFSHVKPVARVPSMAKQPSNVLLEDAKTNWARGSRNMTTAERESARSASRASAFRLGARAIVKDVAKGGVIAAATEAAMSIPENYFHYKRGRKSGEQAAKDAAKSTATAAGFGVATAGIAKGAALVGLSLGPVGTPLMIGGVVLLAGTAVYRIGKAAKRDLPLDEHLIFFCNNTRCKSLFSWEITKMARETH